MGRVVLDSGRAARHPRACHAAPERHPGLPGPRPPPHPEAEGVLRVSPGPASGSAHPLRRAARRAGPESCSPPGVQLLPHGHPSAAIHLKDPHALPRPRRTPSRHRLAGGAAGRPHHPAREPSRQRAPRNPTRRKRAPRNPTRRNWGPFREGSRTRREGRRVVHRPPRPALVGAPPHQPRGRGVAARLAGRVHHGAPRPPRDRLGPHGRRGVAQRGVPGHDHLDHRPPDDLEGGDDHPVPGRARAPAGHGRRPAGRGRPRLERRRRVSRRWCRPDRAGSCWSCRRWPGAGWWPWTRRARRG